MAKRTSVVYHAKFIAILVLIPAVLNGLFLYIYVQEYGAQSKVLTISYLNIGQGDSILIKTPSKQTMLIDGGLVTSNVLAEIGSALPFYKRTIDIVLASHPDADHIGGLPHVIENYTVGAYVDPGVNTVSTIDDHLSQLLEDKHITRLTARRGMRIILDHQKNIYFEVFFPDRDVSTWIKKTNDASIVGRLVYGTTSAWFNGDSPIAIEDELLQSLRPEYMHADILKLGHHGSRTSTGEMFLSKIAPAYAVISAGKDNKYKHPHKEVMDLLKKYPIQVFRTDEDGRITFTSDGSTITVKKQRK